MHAPAALTCSARNRLLSDCDALEVNGLGLVSDVLRVVIAESARADAAVRKVEEMEERIRWLESSIEALAALVDDQPPLRIA